MAQQEKIDILLSLQEHPDKYTDEQLAQMLEDDPELTEMLELISMTKHAIVKMETEKEEIHIDDLWRQFAIKHEEQLSALEANHNNYNQEKHFGFSSQIQKIAAVFVGIIFTAGLAFAVIHLVRSSSSKQPNQSVEEKIAPRQKDTNNSQASYIDVKENMLQQNSEQSSDTIKTDTLTDDKPIVFDNMTLENMLPKISEYYHIDVEFLNEKVRQLRFYFVWKHDETLESVINRLNKFESVEVELKENKIIAK